MKEQDHDAFERLAGNGKHSAKEEAGDTNGNTDGHTKTSLIKSSAEFVADFVPPEYVLDGILQRRFVYSLTARTSGGKTAIALLLTALVALGRALGTREVEQGRVLYLVGENPDDVRMRWIAMAQQMDFDINSIDAHFIPGVFKISEMKAAICTELAAIGEVALVVIDTTAAYFEGADENANKEAGDYARVLRSLVKLPGGPCILALSHPVKNAADDNLIPRGGGAFLNEVDGNCTARNNDGLVELHWQGKFRGPDFAPMSFQLRTVTHERLKDKRGRLMPTVVAASLSEASEQELRTASQANEDKLLKVLACKTSRGASLTELARLAEWTLQNGVPNKMLVMRTLNRLKKQKLVEEDRRGFELTERGRKQVKSNDGHDD